MIIVETSARHVHVTRKDLDILYGEGYQLTKRNDLSQPGQFVSNEKVEVIGNRSSAMFSILGPERKATQVEASLTDARALGLTAPVRESGDLHDAGPVTLKGPKGEVKLDKAVICAKRHIHMTEADAKEYNVTNGEIVKVEVDSPERKLIFDDVVIRVSNSFSLAMHIDTDESNACVGAKEAKIIK
ncbi:MAG: phosphate propanoyltransferase [Lachnospiraceae bacterium]|nr:phosphate propanoyltransferase [Lachnospiraceae bacterium]MBR1844404.1 phosphate propanoyltransferase [Lachnospiraceae bacterium]